MDWLINNLKKKNSDWKINTIAPFLKHKEKILDYGCGDLTFAISLIKKYPNLIITGVDVVDFKNRYKKISFKKYDGKKLPFKTNEFDTAIVVYVFHHCQNAEEAFKECLRVARRLIIIESLPRNKIELPFIKLMDWFYNIIKPEPIPLTYQFHTEKEWKGIFRKNNAKIRTIKEIRTSSFPIIAVGKQSVLEVEKAI